MASRQDIRVRPDGTDMAHAPVAGTVRGAGMRDATHPRTTFVQAPGDAGHR
ncbi:MAG TPA: hypothetical protein VGP03_07975 [Pseudonocardiaceae bacterium]|nr:hypothetical protein [Pseudonocardiaceae bacterium]